MIPSTNHAGVEASLPSLLNVVTGLALVLALIFIVSWVLRKSGRLSPLATDQIKVVASRSVGNREKLMIVAVGDREILLGVTANSINTLYDYPVNASTQKEGFGQLVDQAMGETASPGEGCERRQPS